MIEEREIKVMLHFTIVGLKAALHDHDVAIEANDYYKAQAENYRVLINRSRAEALLEVLMIDFSVTASDDDLIKLEAKING